MNATNVHCAVLCFFNPRGLLLYSRKKKFLLWWSAICVPPAVHLAATPSSLKRRNKHSSYFFSCCVQCTCITKAKAKLQFQWYVPTVQLAMAVTAKSTPTTSIQPRPVGNQHHHHGCESDYYTLERWCLGTCLGP